MLGTIGYAQSGACNYDVFVSFGEYSKLPERSFDFFFWRRGRGILWHKHQILELEASGCQTSNEKKMVRCSIRKMHFFRGGNSQTAHTHTLGFSGAAATHTNWKWHFKRIIRGKRAGQVDTWRKAFGHILESFLSMTWFYSTVKKNGQEDLQRMKEYCRKKPLRSVFFGELQ